MKKWKQILEDTKYVDKRDGGQLQRQLYWIKAKSRKPILTKMYQKINRKLLHSYKSPQKSGAPEKLCSGAVLILKWFQEKLQPNFTLLSECTQTDATSKTSCFSNIEKKYTWNSQIWETKGHVIQRRKEETRASVVMTENGREQRQMEQELLCIQMAWTSFEMQHLLILSSSFSIISCSQTISEEPKHTGPYQN